MPDFHSEPTPPGRRFAVVVSRFNSMVTERLLEGARRAFDEHGVSDDRVDVAWVPGAWEIPVAARRLAESGLYGAVVCLGAVIKGETAHFEYVAGEAARGIAQAANASGVPVLLGVLTTYTLDDAMARAGGKHGNKGYEAAEAALEMASLMAALPTTER
jgi:6,7-dimethyl-8-ribityllumazine synthase